MAVISKLAVSVTLRASNAFKGLKTLRKRMSRLGASVRRIGKVFTGFGARLTALALGGGLAIFVKRTFSAVDSLAKLSDRLGITIGDMAGLKRAARITGVSFETMTKSVEFLQNGIAEARAGIGEAKDAFKGLGLNLDAISQLSPEKAFEKVGQALNGVNNQFQKMRFARDLFGRGGGGLLVLFQQNAGFLDRMRKAADKAGQSLSRIQAAGIEKANDTIGNVADAIGGIGVQLSAKIAPIVTVVGKQLTTWVESVVTSVKLFTNIKGVLEGFRGPLTFMAVIVDAIRAAFDIVKGVFHAVVSLINLAAAGVANLVANVAKVAEAIGLVSEETVKTAEAFRDISLKKSGDSIKQAGGDFVQAFTDTFGGNSLTERVGPGIDAVKRKLDEVSRVQKPKKLLLPKIDNEASAKQFAERLGKGIANAAKSLGLFQRPQFSFAKLAEPFERLGKKVADVFKGSGKGKPSVMEAMAAPGGNVSLVAASQFANAPMGAALGGQNIGKGLLNVGEKTNRLLTDIRGMMLPSGVL